MEWLMRFSQAVDYVEEHLEDVISYEEAAKTACCSPYYFQRMFSYVAGVPLSEYIRRRRMTKAAFALQTGAEKVMEIGARYGYDSPASFHRAFQAVHGVAPSAAREEGTALQAYPRLRLSIQVAGGASLPYRVERKGAMRIVGVRTDLREEVEENFTLVPAFWAELRSNGDRLAEVAALSDCQPCGLLGVTVYHGPGDIGYYIAASTSQAVPAGMSACEIPAAAWVVFDCSGQLPASVQMVFRRFLTEWLPFSGYEYAGLPDMEVYPAGAGGAGELAAREHSEVWIAVRKGSTD